MVCWSDTSQGAGNGRPGERGDDDTSGRTQLVVHAPQSPIRAKPLKRAHLTTPDETERHKGHVRNKHTAIVLKKGKGATEGQAALTCPEISMLNSGSWQDMRHIPGGMRGSRLRKYDFRRSTAAMSSGFRRCFPDRSI